MRCATTAQLTLKSHKIVGSAAHCGLLFHPYIIHKSLDFLVLASGMTEQHITSGAAMKTRELCGGLGDTRQKTGFRMQSSEFNLTITATISSAGYFALKRAVGQIQTFFPLPPFVCWKKFTLPSHFLFNLMRLCGTICGVFPPKTFAHEFFL